MELTQDNLEEGLVEMLAEILAKHYVKFLNKHAEYVLLGSSGDLNDGPFISDRHDHEGFPGGQNYPEIDGDVSEPLRVFDDGPWVWGPEGSEFSGKDLDEAAYVKYRPFINNPSATQGDVIKAATEKLISTWNLWPADARRMVELIAPIFSAQEGC